MLAVRNADGLFMELPMKYALPLAAAMFAFGFAGAANAVDVVNEDRVTQTILVSDDDITVAYHVEGGTRLTRICDSCVMQIGDIGSFKAAGKQVVVISGGKAEVKSN